MNWLFNWPIIVRQGSWTSPVKLWERLLVTSERTIQDENTGQTASTSSSLSANNSIISFVFRREKLSLMHGNNGREKP